MIASAPRARTAGFSDPTELVRARPRMRSVGRWRALTSLGIFALASCGRAPVARHAEPDAARVPSGPRTVATRIVVGPARLYALPAATNTSYSSDDPDGARRVISSGVRLLLHDDGRIERARQVFLAGESIKVAELPARFGKGFLFRSSKNGGTSIWRSSSWTSDLVPFASLPGVDATRLVAGLDRLYVVAGRQLVALDPRSGVALDKGPLPPSPVYDSMAFADEWFGAVEVPLRGVLVTFDAGASWHPLGVMRNAELTLSGDRVIVTSPDGALAVDSTGRTEPEPTDSEGEADEADDDAPAPVERPNAPSVEPLPTDHELGAWPLRLAVLRGWPDSPATALVANDGVLARVRLSDGRVVARSVHAYRGGVCQGLPVGRDVGFACESGSGSELFVATSPLGMRSVARFAETRFIASSGNGAVVVRGGCGSVSRPNAYCVRDPHGNLSEVFVQGADVGTERVVALADGRAVVLVPPLRGSRGSLSIVERDGTQRRVELDYRRVSLDARGLLASGLWLDGLQERSPGTIEGWVVDSDPFVGIRVDLRGRVTAGEVEPSIRTSLVSGPFAFTVHDGGRALETVDGGFVWHDTALIDGSDEPMGVDEPHDERGCTAVGCSFGSWLRVGWNGRRKPIDLTLATAPAPTAPPGGDIARPWLSCGADGRRSAAALPVPEGATRPRMRRRLRLDDDSDLTGGPWAPFLDVSPPLLGASEIGFDGETRGDTDSERLRMRGYVWGPRALDNWRGARWLLRAVDRFDLGDDVWSSSVTTAPWDSLVGAAQAFGYETSTAATWHAELEPSGKAAALLISQSATADLYLFERGRGIVHVADAFQQGMASLAGVVKVGGTWWIGTRASMQPFRVLRIEGDRVAMVLEFPLGDERRTGALGIDLVRSASGDALGIAVESLGSEMGPIFVYPVDPAAGTLAEPTTITQSALASDPRACTDDDLGWLVTRTYGASLDFGKLSGPLSARRLEARLRVSAAGVCVESLAAEADSVPTLSPASPPANPHRTIPLVVSERRAGARRWGFGCAAR